MVILAGGEGAAGLTGRKESYWGLSARLCVERDLGIRMGGRRVGGQAGWGVGGQRGMGLCPSW